MNFLQLQQRLARRRGANDSSLATATAARYKDALNEVHRTLLRMPGMDSLRHAIVTFATVASTQQYALPVQGIARVNRIVEITNQRKLEMRTLAWLRSNDPAPSLNQGTPWAWIPVGYTEVHTQPSDASEIFVKSTSAGDTTQTAFIEGIITGGYYRTASVVLTGTTAVTLSATITNFIQITKFYLSAVGAGIVTLQEDSGAGTELSRIAIGDTRAQFYSLFLENVPSAAITYYADCLRSIPDMSNNTDEPLIPDDFHDVLIDGAELREFTKQDDPQRWALVKGRYEDGKRDLKSFVVNHPDWRPQWGGAPAEVSTLGAWFPADTA